MDNAELRRRIRAAYKSYRKMAVVADKIRRDNKIFLGEADMDYHDEGVSDGIGYEHEEFLEDLKKPAVSHIRGWFELEMQRRIYIAEHNRI